jgi:hypothetical protein
MGFIDDICCCCCKKKPKSDSAPTSKPADKPKEEKSNITPQKTDQEIPIAPPKEEPKPTKINKVTPPQVEKDVKPEPVQVSEPKDEGIPIKSSLGDKLPWKLNDAHE